LSIGLDVQFKAFLPVRFGSSIKLVVGDGSEYFFAGFVGFDGLSPVTRLLCVKVDRKGSREANELPVDLDSLAIGQHASERA